jgi:hypothetical protein
MFFCLGALLHLLVDAGFTRATPMPCKPPFLSWSDVSAGNWWLQACQKHGVAPGVFCLGEARAAQLAAQGYTYVAYDTDLGVVMNCSASTMAKLKA